ncbi:phage lytic cycle repressor MrpR family protein [Priestia endophytica]
MLRETMYNQKLKEEFLSNFDNEATKTMRADLFERTRTTETSLGKDLKDFTFKESIDLLAYLGMPTIPALQMKASFINVYVAWCYENGHRASNEVPLRNLGAEDYEKLLSDKKLYLSKDEMDEILNNGQIPYANRVIVSLIFEGVGGTNLHSEIRNLKEEHIDFDNRILTLYDDKLGERKLQVSEQCIDLIKSALMEETFSLSTPEGVSSYHLEETGYVMKTGVTRRARSKEEDRPQGQMIAKRIREVSYMYDLPYFTVANIKRSGMIKRAVDLFKEHKKLSAVEYQEIAKQFNVGINKDGTFNTYKAVNQFTSRRNIMDLYSIDIESPVFS